MNENATDEMGCTKSFSNDVLKSEDHDFKNFNKVLENINNKKINDSGNGENNKMKNGTAKYNVKNGESFDMAKSSVINGVQSKEYVSADSERPVTYQSKIEITLKNKENNKDIILINKTNSSEKLQKCFQQKNPPEIEAKELVKEKNRNLVKDVHQSKDENQKNVDLRDYENVMEQFYSKDKIDPVRYSKIDNLESDNNFISASDGFLKSQNEATALEEASVICVIEPPEDDQSNSITDLPERYSDREAIGCVVKETMLGSKQESFETETKKSTPLLERKAHNEEEEKQLQEKEMVSPKVEKESEEVERKVLEEKKESRNEGMEYEEVDKKVEKEFQGLEKGSKVKKKDSHCDEMCYETNFQDGDQKYQERERNSEIRENDSKIEGILLKIKMDSQKTIKESEKDDEAYEEPDEETFLKVYQQSSFQLHRDSIAVFKLNHGNHRSLLKKFERRNLESQQELDDKSESIQSSSSTLDIPEDFQKGKVLKSDPFCCSLNDLSECNSQLYSPTVPLRKKRRCPSVPVMSTFLDEIKNSANETNHPVPPRRKRRLGKSGRGNNSYNLIMTSKNCSYSLSDLHNMEMEDIEFISLKKEARSESESSIPELILQSAFRKSRPSCAPVDVTFSTPEITDIVTEGGVICIKNMQHRASICVLEASLPSLQHHRNHDPFEPNKTPSMSRKRSHTFTSGDKYMHEVRDRVGLKKNTGNTVGKLLRRTFSMKSLKSNDNPPCMPNLFKRYKQKSKKSNKSKNISLSTIHEEHDNTCDKSQKSVLSFASIFMQDDEYGEDENGQTYLERCTANFEPYLSTSVLFPDSPIMKKSLSNMEQSTEPPIVFQPFPLKKRRLKRSSSCSQNKPHMKLLTEESSTFSLNPEAIRKAQELLNKSLAKKIPAIEIPVPPRRSKSKLSLNSYSTDSKENIDPCNVSLAKESTDSRVGCSFDDVNNFEPKTIKTLNSLKEEVSNSNRHNDVTKVDDLENSEAGSCKFYSDESRKEVENSTEGFNSIFSSIEICPLKEEAVLPFIFEERKSSHVHEEFSHDDPAPVIPIDKCNRLSESREEIDKCDCEPFNHDVSPEYFDNEEDKRRFQRKRLESIKHHSEVLNQISQKIHGIQEYNRSHHDELTKKFVRRFSHEFETVGNKITLDSEIENSSSVNGELEASKAINDFLKTLESPSLLDSLQNSVDESLLEYETNISLNNSEELHKKMQRSPVKPHEETPKAQPEYVNPQPNLSDEPTSQRKDCKIYECPNKNDAKNFKVDGEALVRECKEGTLNVKLQNISDSFAKDILHQTRKISGDYERCTSPLISPKDILKPDKALNLSKTTKDVDYFERKFTITSNEAFLNVDDVKTQPAKYLESVNDDKKVVARVQEETDNKEAEIGGFVTKSGPLSDLKHAESEIKGDISNHCNLLQNTSFGNGNDKTLASLDDSKINGPKDDSAKQIINKNSLLFQTLNSTSLSQLQKSNVFHFPYEQNATNFVPQFLYNCDQILALSNYNSDSSASSSPLQSPIIAIRHSSDRHGSKVIEVESPISMRKYVVTSVKEHDSPLVSPLFEQPSKEFGIKMQKKHANNDEKILQSEDCVDNANILQSKKCFENNRQDESNTKLSGSVTSPEENTLTKEATSNSENISQRRNDQKLPSESILKLKNKSRLKVEIPNSNLSITNDETFKKVLNPLTLDNINNEEKRVVSEKESLNHFENENNSKNEKFRETENKDIKPGVTDIINRNDLKTREKTVNDYCSKSHIVDSDKVNNSDIGERDYDIRNERSLPTEIIQNSKSTNVIQKTVKTETPDTNASTFEIASNFLEKEEFDSKNKNEILTVNENNFKSSKKALNFSLIKSDVDFKTVNGCTNENNSNCNDDQDNFSNLNDLTEKNCKDKITENVINTKVKMQNSINSEPSKKQIEDFFRFRNDNFTDNISDNQDELRYPSTDIKQSDGSHVNQLEKDHVNQSKRDHVNQSERDHVNQSERDHVNQSERDYVNQSERDGVNLSSKPSETNANHETENEICYDESPNNLNHTNEKRDIMNETKDYLDSFNHIKECCLIKCNCNAEQDDIKILAVLEKFLPVDAPDIILRTWEERQDRERTRVNRSSLNIPKWVQNGLWQNPDKFFPKDTSLGHPHIDTSKDFEHVARTQESSTHQKKEEDQIPQQDRCVEVYPETLRQRQRNMAPSPSKVDIKNWDTNSGGSDDDSKGGKKFLPSVKALRSQFESGKSSNRDVSPSPPPSISPQIRDNVNNLGRTSSNSSTSSLVMSSLEASSGFSSLTSSQATSELLSRSTEDEPVEPIFNQFHSVDENLVESMGQPPSTIGWNPQPLLKKLYYIPEAPKMHNQGTNYVNIDGYLEKLPSGRKKATFWNAWKRRYFVAKDGILYYYQNNQTEKANMKLALMGGKVEIMDQNMVNIDDGDKNQRSASMLGIDDGKGHYVVVRCPTRQEAERWKKALDTHIVEDFNSQYIQPWPRPTNPTLLRDTLVIDIGSCSVRAGVLASQPTLPQLFFPAVVATNRETRNQIWGAEALLPHNRTNSTIAFPIRPSHKISKFSVDLNSISSLLQKTFKDLKVDPKNYNIQLSVPRVLNPLTQAELLKILFDKFGVKAVNLTHQSILALYAYNATSGIVVDIGERIDVVPVTDGYIVDGGVSRIPYGGFRILDHIRQFLFQRNLSLVNEVDSYVIRQTLETVCYSAQHYNTEKQRCALNTDNFEKTVPLADFFPDTPQYEAFRNISLDFGRFQATEGLFNPDAWGLDHPGLQKLVHKAIQECSMDIRKEMSRSIFLSGGLSQLPGISERLTVELDNLTPPAIRPKVHSSPYRYHAAYLGACVLAESPAFIQSKITKEEWQKQGNSALRKWAL